MKKPPLEALPLKEYIRQDLLRNLNTLLAK